MKFVSIIVAITGRNVFIVISCESENRGIWTLRHFQGLYEKCFVIVFCKILKKLFVSFAKQALSLLALWTFNDIN